MIWASLPSGKPASRGAVIAHPGTGLAGSKNWRAREPLCAVGVAVPIARRVAVPATRDSFYDVFAARNKFYIAPGIRGLMRLLCIPRQGETRFTDNE